MVPVFKGIEMMNKMSELQTKIEGRTNGAAPNFLERTTIDENGTVHTRIRNHNDLEFWLTLDIPIERLLELYTKAREQVADNTQTSDTLVELLIRSELQQKSVQNVIHNNGIEILGLKRKILELQEKLLEEEKYSKELKSSIIENPNQTMMEIIRSLSRTYTNDLDLTETEIFVKIEEVKYKYGIRVSMSTSKKTFTVTPEVAEDFKIEGWDIADGETTTATGVVTLIDTLMDKLPELVEKFFKKQEEEAAAASIATFVMPNNTVMNNITTTLEATATHN